MRLAAGADDRCTSEVMVEAKGLRLLGHGDLGERAFGGEGMALVARGSRRYLFVAHVWAPHAFSTVDVTDPRRPAVVFQSDARMDHEDARANSLSLSASGDVLAVAYQCRHVDRAPAGVELFDVGEPTRPRSISFFSTSGPQSIGTHRVWLAGDRVFMSTGFPDFEPTHPLDHQGVSILDVADPAHPREIGRWWVPGTRVGDEAPPPPRNPHGRRFELGYRAHNVMCYPERPDRCYVAYEDGGLYVLDIAQPSRPRVVSWLNFHPFSAHTVVPLFGRKLLAVTDEAHLPNAEDNPKLLWLMDVSVEGNILPLGTGPLPDVREFARRGGRFGTHNLHENEPIPGAWHSEREIVGSFFSAGIRIYDIADPFHPRETAFFIPDAPGRDAAGSTHVTDTGGESLSALPPADVETSVSQINDVYADERGIVYAVDRLSSDLYVLERT